MDQLVLLIGKYDGNNNPKGARGLLFTKDKTRDIQPLIQLMREVGQKHDGKTPAQVAINWCLCKGTLPIPGRAFYQTSGNYVELDCSGQTKKQAVV